MRIDSTLWNKTRENNHYLSPNSVCISEDYLPKLRGSKARFGHLWKVASCPILSASSQIAQPRSHSTELRLPFIPYEDPGDAGKEPWPGTLQEPQQKHTATTYCLPLFRQSPANPILGLELKETCRSLKCSLHLTVTGKGARVREWPTLRAHWDPP